MTVIAACVRNGAAAMASDALGSMNDLELPGRRKLFDCGGAMLGYAGASIFRRVFEALPSCGAGREDEFCVTVVTALRQFVADNGLDEDEYHCAVLVASPGGVWLATSVGDIEKIDSEYWATGSGGAVALGAMYAFDQATAKADTMVEIGVMAACALTLSCGGDITIMEM